MALTIVASVVPSLAGNLEISRSAKLHMVPRHVRAGRLHRAAPGRAESGYIENQLQNFYERRRDNPFSKQYMWGAAASLSPQTARDLAVYFAALPARAAGDGSPELAVAGKVIYQQGMPEADVVPCSVCHGPNAEGAGEIPRLGGLSYFYLKRRLAQWVEGYHAAAAPPMPRIASKLSPDAIEALASYLSFVQ